MSNQLALNRARNPPGRDISAGFFHTLVIQREPIPEKGGTKVVGFGSNRNTILGQPGKHYLDRPKDLECFSGAYISAVGCGCNHSVFLEKRPDQDGGDVWSIGLGSNGRLGVEWPDTDDKLHELLKHSNRGKEKKSHRDAKKKGFNVGSGCEGKKWHMNVPVKVPFSGKENIISLACGLDHTLVLTERGAIFAWGLGSYGNLGTGTTEDVYKPTEILMDREKPVQCVMIAAGTKHSMSLTREGSMYSWGHGGNGRLGQGEKCEASLVPGKVKADSKSPMKWIAVGEAHSSCIDTLGNVYCWGAGTYGRTGHGEESDDPVPKQVRSLGGCPCSESALGTLHSLVLTDPGKLLAWGCGSATGIKTSNKEDAFRATPTDLHIEKLKDGDYVIHITAGYFHSLALTFQSQIFTWGKGSEGRLGTGKMLDEPQPMRLFLNEEDQDAAEEAAGQEREGTAPFFSVESEPLAAGGMHSACLYSGELWLWGSNDSGQIGTDNGREDVDTSVRLQIKEIGGMSRIKVGSVALGLEHSFFISMPEKASQARKLYAWGRNQAGQLGLGNTDDHDHPDPQLVTFIPDACAIAAGEDHSAAVLPSGDLFTWGAAQNGKLGHGSHDGFQNYPRKLRLSDQVKSVACGEQHTAFLNSQGHLFTFGSGWFGRLGLGDMTNQTFPMRVERFYEKMEKVDPTTNVSETVLGTIPAPKVRDVQCGSYHTCILTEDTDELWVCGQDSMVCDDEHVNRPIRFGADKGIHGKVQHVAVGARHTLCITKNGDLFSWGSNSKGQLGIGFPQYPPKGPKHEEERILQKHRRNFTTNLVDFSRRSFDDVQVTHIAAGYAHSMAKLKSGKVVAWGCGTSGRLGLKEDAIDKEKDNIDMIWDPRHVNMDWEENEPQQNLENQSDSDGGEPEQAGAPALEDGQKEQKDDDEEEAMRPDPDTGDTNTLGKLQKKLQNEDVEQKEHKLKEKEAKLTENYNDFITHIYALWDKPSQVPQEETQLDEGDLTFCEDAGAEWLLRSLRGQLESTLCRNLRRMELSDDYPDLDGLTIPPEVSQVLVYYEELVWLLQQQPCYLARLSQKKMNDIPVSKLKLREEVTIPDRVFLTTVERIFREIGNDRVRHHFIALIRRVISMEILETKEGTKDNPGRRVDWIFAEKDSTVNSLMKILVNHAHFGGLHAILFDPENEDSLIHFVAATTFKYNPNRNQHHRPDEAVEGDDKVIFAFDAHDIVPWHKSQQRMGEEADDAGDPESTNSKLTEARGTLSGHQKGFQDFIGKDQELDESKHKKTFSHYLFKVFNLDKDIRQVLVKATNVVRDYRSGSSTPLEKLEQVLAMDASRGKRKGTQVDLTPNEKAIFEPVLRLLMYALCSLMEDADKIMAAQMFTSKFRRMVIKMKGDLEKNLERKVKELKEKGEFAEAARIQKKIDEEADEGMKMVLANLANLGKFLHMSAKQDLKNSQDPIQRTAGMCRGSFMRYIKSQVDSMTDKIGTDLTIDLYSSHYDIQDHFVMIRTSELLNLSNALWLFHGQVERDTTNKGDSFKNPVIEDPESDRVYQLLCKIQPPDVDEKEMQRRKESNWPKDELLDHSLITRVWKPHDVLNTGDRQDVLHNLVISHRFLETQREMCFCRQCDAPVPRNVAPKDQRYKTEKRLLQVYRANLGPKMDGKSPFADLEGVVAGLPHTGTVLKSKDFTGMKFELEDLQKNAAQKRGDNFDFLDLIEKGKRALDIVRTHQKYQFKDFIEYLVSTFTDRVKHRRYLKNLDEGTAVIKEIKKEYYQRFKEQVRTLSGVVFRSSLVQVPPLLKAVASAGGVKLRFLDIEKVKKREDRKAKDFLIGGEIELRPSETFSIYQLIRKKVVRRLNVPKQQYVNIYLTFNLLEPGDWEVITEHRERQKSHMLCNFVITNADLEKMKKAGKTEKREFNEGFVVMSCFSLLQLLARVRASDIRV